MNILITGGSRGIGKEAALRLSDDRNNQILITGRNEKALRAVADSATHDNISYYIIDLLYFEQNAGPFCEHVASVFSIIDVLVNNAGFLVNRRFSDLKQSEIRSMMETNFFAPASIIRSMLPFMRKGSHIVNIASMGGVQGSVKFPGLSGYSASKAAVASLTECLALEFSEMGISVNCIAPGSVQTEMLEEAFPGFRAPVSAKEMGNFLAEFAIKGNRFFNGKILPVALSTP